MVKPNGKHVSQGIWQIQQIASPFELRVFVNVFVLLQLASAENFVFQKLHVDIVLGKATSGEDDKILPGPWKAVQGVRSCPVLEATQISGFVSEDGRKVSGSERGIDVFTSLREVT